MEKKIIEEVVFRKQNDHDPIKFGEIDIDLLPDDVIIAGFDEGFYSENNSWDAHYYLQIHRGRLENDDEFKKREKMEIFIREDRKKKRYESYLKLKKEFEDGSNY